MSDVALVAHNVVRGDGQGRVMLELGRTLAARGHHVTVYAHSLDEDLAALVRWQRVPRARGPQLVDEAWFLPAATAAVRRGAHDVTCVMGPCAVPPRPYVFYAQFSHHGWQRTWTPTSRPAARHRLHSRLGMVRERAVAARAAAVIACSEEVAEDVGWDGRAAIVPNGIDLDEFPMVSPLRRDAARAELGLPDDAFTVTFVGEYHTTRKGLAPLLDALALGEHTDEHLLVAGSGDARVRDDTAGRALGGRAHFLGYTDVRAAIAAADVVAVPSLYEPFSIVALEAAAAGIPLVISARAGAADHLAGASVVVDDPESPASLRAALDLVRSEPDRSRALAAVARQKAEDLRWERCAGGAADVIESVVASAREASRG